MKLLKYRREQDLEQRRYIQRLVEEEKGKITSDNSDELIADLHLSKEKGDNIREQAIVKKLAENGDFNDLMDYLKLPSNMAGMHKFFNEWLIGGSKINKQIAEGHRPVAQGNLQINELIEHRKLLAQGKNLI